MKVYVFIDLVYGFKFNVCLSLCIFIVLFVASYAGYKFASAWAVFIVTAGAGALGVKLLFSVVGDLFLRFVLWVHIIWVTCPLIGEI